MDQPSTLLEVAALLRKAASLLEGSATGHDPNARLPRTPGLGKQIERLLADGSMLTSAEVADALHVDNPGVDAGTFRRRVIVTLSAMNRKSGAVELVETFNGNKWRAKSTRPDQILLPVVSKGPRNNKGPEGPSS